MKEIGKLLIKELIIISVCAFLGVAALAVTYLVSPDDIRENVRESAIILYNEGLGAQIWEGIKESQLDIYTDGLLFNVSYTSTDDGLKDILLDTRVKVGDTNPMNSLFEVIALANDNYYVKNYARYWHGYQIILRPLLLYFNYSDIRQLNMIFQLLLVFILVYLLAVSEDRALIIPFFGVYIALSPISLFSCLQYSPCFYIMMASLIALFALKKYLNDTTRNYLFLLAGILTAYFDLLTFPLITLAIPLIAYLGSNCVRLAETKDRGLKDTIFYTVSWCIGYVGMWASKWIIAAILTGENAIEDAIERIKYRSGYSQDYTYFDVVKLNLSMYNAKVQTKVLLIAVICLAAYIIALVIKNYKNKKHITFDTKLLPNMGVILFVTIYPLIWYFFTTNHSNNHNYFTYKELAISVFGILMIGLVSIKSIIVIPHKPQKM